MLYFVATPIGNLKDMTYRAVETLESVDIIACEDTRHSVTLLNAYNIKKPLMAYHKFNEREAGAEIIQKLKDGKNIAVITDAGMPVISDPGNVLVKLLIENNLEYTVVPGASAFTSALVLSGIDSSKFAFLGFMPEKNYDRKELLEKYKNLDMTLIFYSAPHDIVKDIESIKNVFGTRKAVAVREITKLHETVEFFNLQDGLKSEPRGEYVLLVEGGKVADEFENLSNEEYIKTLVKSGMDKKDALKTVAKKRGIPKSQLYKFTIDI